jgi:hypothetical protein
MRPIGFSTGALAYGNFREGLRMLGQIEVQAVELSALRQGELDPLLQAIPSLDLSRFDYISIHLPSQFEVGWEAVMWRLIVGGVPSGWPIVLHPDAIGDFRLWRELAARGATRN